MLMGKVNKNSYCRRDGSILSISKKDFKQTLCSEHSEVGGKETYMKNMPTVTSKISNAKPLVERSTQRARNEGTAGSTETEIQKKYEAQSK